MAEITVSNLPERIAANNADTDNVLQFDTEFTIDSETQTAHIRIPDAAVGVFKFNVGKLAADSDADYIAGDELFLKFNVKNRPIHFTQSDAADVFDVSLI